MSSFRFLKKTEYGLIMMTLLVREGRGRVMSAKKMQDFGLPRSFMAKIAKDLIEEGIVGAKEGRGGGYFLIKTAKQVNLKKVVEALEGKISTVTCVDGEGRCPIEKTCQHSKTMKKLSEELAGVMEKYTLEDLVRE